MALLGLATSVHAVTWGLEGFAGYNTHSMAVWNDDLALANASGAQFDPLDHTLTYGLGARAWVGRTWMARAQWEPLDLFSSDPPTGRKLSFDTSTLRLDAAWFPPRSGRARFGFGAGLGSYWLHGARELNGRKNADLEGHTFGMQLEGLGEWALRDRLSLTAAAGYRRASMAKLEVNGQTESFETNYSGYMLRLGIALYATAPSRE